MAVENCISKAPATRQDVDPGDNSFHCPIVGSWVELGLTPQKDRIMCLSNCPKRDDSLIHEEESKK